MGSLFFAQTLFKVNRENRIGLITRSHLCCLMFLFQSINTFSQVVTTDDRLKKIEETLSVIEKRITEEGDQHEEVGKFVLFELNDIKVHRLRSGKKSYSKSTPNPITIQSVKLNIKDGAIVDMQVITTGNETFTNYVAPISINLFNESGNYLTFLNRDGVIDAIYTNNFIRWERERGFNPEDRVVTLDSKTRTQTLRRGVGINHVIDLSLFTDLPGLFGDKPNGITQTEAFVKLVTNNGPLKYPFTEKINFKIKSPLILCKFISLRATFSRFDSKYEAVKMNADSSVSRQDLLQRSDANVDLTLNLFSTWLPKKSANWFNANAGAGIYGSDLLSLDDTVSVVLPYFFLEPTFEVKAAQNFGLDLSLKFIRQYAPQLPKDGDWRWIFRPQATLYWSPPGDVGSKIFARAAFVNDLHEKKAPFYQIQVGYSIRFSDLVAGRGNKNAVQDEEN